MHQWALQHRKPNDGRQHQQSGKKLGWPGKADHECQSRLNLRALLLSAPILWADIGVAYFLGYETSQLWLDAGHPDSLCLSVAGIRRYTNKHLFLQLTSLLSANITKRYEIWGSPGLSEFAREWSTRRQEVSEWVDWCMGWIKQTIQTPEGGGVQGTDLSTLERHLQFLPFWGTLMLSGFCCCFVLFWSGRKF